MCSAHFTRKFGAKRHNRTLHNNKGSYVSFLEYVIGRVSGKYSAGDPWIYRRKKKKAQNFLSKKSTIDAVELASATDSGMDAFSCGTVKESIARNNTEKQRGPIHTVAQSQHETADNNKQSSDDFYEFQEGIHILAEIKGLLSKFCSLEHTQTLLFCWNSYIFSTKNLQKMYEYLAWLRKEVKWRESLSQLSPIGQMPILSFECLRSLSTNNRAKYENETTFNYFNAFTSQQQSYRGNSYSVLGKSTPTSDENNSSRIFSRQRKDSSYSIPEIPTVPDIPR